jgi:hypothetical protein
MCSRIIILTFQDCLLANQIAASSVADLRVVPTAWDLGLQALVRLRVDAEEALDLALAFSLNDLKMPHFASRLGTQAS